MKTTADPPTARTGHGAGGDVLAGRQWLAAHLHDPLVRVIEVDVSPAAYNDWHIDGAVLWDVYGDLKDADYRTAAPGPFSGSSRARGSPRNPPWCSTGMRPPWACG